MNKAIVREIQHDEVEELVSLADADDHIVLFPTHVVEKDGKISGYLSIGAIPTVNLWLDSKRLKGRDSFGVMIQLEEILKDSGISKYYMPCGNGSPLQPFMEKVGFSRLFSTVIYVKSLFNREG